MEFKDNEVDNWINGMSKEPNQNNKPRIVDDAGVDIETGKSAMPSMTVDKKSEQSAAANKAFKDLFGE